MKRAQSEADDKFELRKRFAERRRELRHGYACTAETFQHELNSTKESRKICKILQKIKTVHTLHPTVRKAGLVAEFEVRPHDLAAASSYESGPPLALRCTRRLADLTEPLPVNVLELVNIDKIIPQELDGSPIVVQSLDVVRSDNPCPFELIFTSNLKDLIDDYSTNVSRGDFVSGEAAPPCKLPELPKKGGMMVLPHGNQPHSSVQGKCIAPYAYTEAEMTRALGMLTPERLQAGIVMTDWVEHNSMTVQRYGVMSNDHFVAIFARLNDKQYNLAFHRLGRDTATKFLVLLPQVVIEELTREILERMENAVPHCNFDEVIFELTRRAGGYNWLNKRGLFDEHGEIKLEESYRVRVEMDLVYTMFSSRENNAYVAVPDIRLLLDSVDNTRELEKHIKDEVEMEMQASSVTFDFAKLKMEM